MPVNPSIFRRAIEVIRARGWNTGDLGSDVYDGAVCINGALMEAQGLTKDYNHYSEPSYAEVAAEIAKTLELGYDCYDPETEPAYRIERWNDSEAGGQNSVIDALERTAERLEGPQTKYRIYYSDAHDGLLPGPGNYSPIQIDFTGRDEVDVVQQLVDRYPSIYNTHPFFLVGVDGKNGRLVRVNVSWLFRKGRASLPVVAV